MRSRIIFALLLAVVATPMYAGISHGQTSLGPEPPAKIPAPTTLPSMRNQPGLGPEAPAAMPGASTLISPRSLPSLGPEAPMAAPAASTLPSMRGVDLPNAPPPPPASGTPGMIDNGNGTSTIIKPDGSVQVIPTPK